MATINATLKTWQTDKKGRHLVMLRLEAGNRTKYISLGIKVSKSYWNPKKGEIRAGHPHAEDLNRSIQKRVHAAEKVLHRMTKDKQSITADTLKDAITKPTDSSDFWTFADVWLEERRKRDQVYYWRRARAVLRKFEDTAGRPLTWRNFTFQILKAFDLSMVEKSGNSGSTRAVALRIIKTIVKEAVIGKKLKPNDNPYAQFKMPESEPVKRSKLSAEELERMQALSLDSESWEGLSRDMYMLSFYARGLRFGDVVRLRWSDISEGRLMIKTGKTGKYLSAPITHQIQMILDRCESAKEPNDFVFRAMKGINFQSLEHEVATVSSINARINKSLKEVAKLAGIDKKVSFHTSRHSFAHAAYSSGIDNRTIQKALNHSKPSMTDSYLNNLDDQNLDLKLEKLYGSEKPSN